MKKTMELAGRGLALVIALCLGTVPTLSAAVAHQFRDPSTGAALTARVEDDNKYYGDGSQLTGVVAATASALAANPTDCGDGFYALGIDADGTAVCSAVDDTVGGVNGSTAAITSNQHYDHLNDASAHSAGIAGNAATASALASDPTDCSANQFANAIAADGDLTCAAIADADVPNDITIDNASTADALSADPTDCSANQFANAIAASGNLSCAALTDADVPDTITASNYQPLDADLTSWASHYEGKFTKAGLCSDTPGAVGNVATQSDAPYQIWTATGTAAGQWMGMFNGLGPC